VTSVLDSTGPAKCQTTKGTWEEWWESAPGANSDSIESSEDETKQLEDAQMVGNCTEFEHFGGTKTISFRVCKQRQSFAHHLGPEPNTSCAVGMPQMPEIGHKQPKEELDAHNSNGL